MELVGKEDAPDNGIGPEDLFPPGARPLGATHVWVPNQQHVGEEHLQDTRYGPTPLLDFTGPRLLQTQLQQGQTMQSLTQR